MSLCLPATTSLWKIQLYELRPAFKNAMLATHFMSRHLPSLLRHSNRVATLCESHGTPRPLIDAMYHDAPEVTPNTAPEEHYQPPETCHRPDKPVPYISQHQPHEEHTPLQPIESRGHSRRKSVLVYAVMTTLIVAVIGLAVATGLGMKRAAAAEIRATTAEKRALVAEDQLSTYVIPTTEANNTTTSVAPTGPLDASFGAIDRGCSSIADTVNGSIYTTPGRSL